MIQQSFFDYHHLEGSVAGLDEAGRGPLAGPVIAAAVILNPDQIIPGLDDSKKLSAKKRAFLAKEIRCHALDWSIGRAEVFEIDELNILRASLLAMSRAFNGLTEPPHQALVDGNQIPEIPCTVTAIVRGDAKVACIAAASILAKVFRDNEMRDLDKKYPGYGFAQNKGYPTRKHLMSLNTMGPTEMHRQSFAPVKRLINQSG